MLAQVGTAAVARVTAALVAVTLTGAPRVLALSAPAERHRCSCPAHGDHHECECALCRKAALTVQATDETLPPCHRAAAQKALGDTQSDASRGAPGLEGTCGSGARPALTLAGVEPFCLPAGGALRVPLPARPLELPAGPRRERALEPETPPPRAA
jgi:hypothetical protein